MSAPHDGELGRLWSARAVREQATLMLARAERGDLAHFTVDMGALPALARRVASLATEVYPNLRDVPYHGRYRHFEAGGVDRLGELDRRLAGKSVTEQLCARADLVIVSVLLDAGAGGAWSFHEVESGAAFARSEGLAVASYRWFVGGGLSAEPEHDPLRVDASRLLGVDRAALAAAFGVGETKPLVGLDGRVELLRRLGTTVLAGSDRFGAPPRPGGLAVALFERAENGSIRASQILDALLAGLGAIWPGREQLAGVNLGDVWTHSRFGRIPFHKLSQWLAYSLCEPLEQAGAAVTCLDELTGLAEYRNGGLFVDGGVIVPKNPAALAEAHAVGSDLVIEWRALTVALLDRIAAALRGLWGVDERELPLCKVLEAGTWRAGRVLAAERRRDAAPPIRVDSDGTVF